MAESKELLGYQAAVEQVRARLSRVADTVWAGLGSYRDADIDRLVRLVVPHVRAGQVQVANLTAAYFRALGAAAPVDAAVVTGGRGVPAEDVYRRPGTTVYTELAQGKPVGDAIAAGGERLLSLVMTDLQMAKVRQAQRSLSSAGVAAFRRVLTGRENCALCVIASTQRYHRGDLLPIHPGCDCSVDTLPKGWDPDAQVIDQNLLDLTHDTIAAKIGRSELSARDLGLGKTDSRGRPISDYTDLIATRTHGEYGPTLAWRDENFTSKADIPALS